MVPRHVGGDPVERAAQHEPPVEEPLETALQVERPAREPAHRGDLVRHQVGQLDGVEPQAQAPSSAAVAAADHDARAVGRCSVQRAPSTSTTRGGSRSRSAASTSSGRCRVKGGGQVVLEEPGRVERRLLPVDPRAHVHAHDVQP